MNGVSGLKVIETFAPSDVLHVEYEPVIKRVRVFGGVMNKARFRGAIYIPCRSAGLKRVIIALQGR